MGGKLYCEPVEEWRVHRYASPATGIVVHGLADANMDDCDADGMPADHDGHSEFAFGGAWLLVGSGTGEPSADPTAGAGTLYCYGEEGHHANFLTARATDAVLGAGATLTIAADNVDVSGTGDGCGDWESDASTTGIGSVTATFPHGLDGAYVVFVEGSRGEIDST